MRRRAVWLAMATLGLFLSASPAYAQGWRWLEKLSGPGDFYGFELDVKVWCHYDEVAALVCHFTAMFDQEPEGAEYRGC